MANVEHILMPVVEQIARKLDQPGLTLTTSPVQYGLRLALISPEGKAEGHLYYSPKKKRASWVPIPNGDKKIAELLNQSVAETIGQGSVNSNKRTSKNISQLEAQLTSWIGSDEAGKGELFGPLVVGAFHAEKNMLGKLMEMGIRDSKKMSLASIRKAAAKIEEIFPQRFTVVTISPEKYNKIYDDFSKKGGINGILGWAHAKALEKLHGYNPNIEFAVIDKFAAESRIRPYLGSAFVVLR